MLHVQVELLNHALLEIGVLRLDGAHKSVDRRRSRKHARTDMDSRRRTRYNEPDVVVGNTGAGKSLGTRKGQAPTTLQTVDY